MEGKLQLLNKSDQTIWMRRVDEKGFNRLQRLLELLPDEESLETLDKAIDTLEESKREVTEKIAKKLSDTTDMTKMLRDALMALPMKHIEKLEKRISKLKMEREPGGDCLLISNGETKVRINL